MCDLRTRNGPATAKAKSAAEFHGKCKSFIPSSSKLLVSLFDGTWRKVVKELPEPARLEEMDAPKIRRRAGAGARLTMLFLDGTIMRRFYCRMVANG
jgi:hypothetical protein